MVEEVALMPTTVPLSMSLPVLKAEELVQIALKPFVPEPDKPEPAAAMVIWPRVEVVRVTLEPAIRLTTPQEPLPCAPKSWPAKVGEAEVAVPPLAMESWPVQPGIKVKVLAVVVEMLMVILVSEVVATWIAGPERAEIEVIAEVK